MAKVINLADSVVCETSPFHSLTTIRIRPRSEIICFSIHAFLQNSSKTAAEKKRDSKRWKQGFSHARWRWFSALRNLASSIHEENHHPKTRIVFRPTPGLPARVPPDLKRNMASLLSTSRLTCRLGVVPASFIASLACSGQEIVAVTSHRNKRLFPQSGTTLWWKSWNGRCYRS